MAQTKEQSKFLEIDAKEAKIQTLSDNEFKMTTFEDSG